MSSVTFEGVSKRFGEVIAVDDLCLEVTDGEFLVLLGPSGCGKTTVLRLLAGLDQVTSGRMKIGDRDITDIEAKDRDVAMVFQSYALYPHLSVAKNIESPLIARRFDVGDSGSPRKLTRHERDERVLEGAAILGLTDLMDRKPAALSGGQRQRVALARAIVSRPSVFLFDEPLSNLDAKLRAQTRIELVGLHRKLATTFMYVTHDQVEAMTMADRIAIIADGKLQQVGRPQDVYDRPGNLFVAGFIGSPPMNVLPATVRHDNSDLWVELGAAGRLKLDGIADRSRLTDGCRVAVGIRPEHLSASRSNTEASSGAQAQTQAETQAQGHTQWGIDTTVRAVEWLGHERHLVLDVAGSPLILREPSEGAAPSVGESLRVSAESDEIHLFDPESGERLT